MLGGKPSPCCLPNLHYETVPVGVNWGVGERVQVRKQRFSSPQGHHGTQRKRQLWEAGHSGGQEFTRKPARGNQFENVQKPGVWHWNLPEDIKWGIETILFKSQRTG